MLIFIFFGLNFVQSQTKIAGSIIEKNTINAIAYATIKQDNEFITADEKGAFFLNYKSSVAITDSILISCIGYKNKKIGVLANLKEGTLNIELEQSVYLLNEVLVKSFKLETDAKVIFKKFAAKFSNKINNQPFDSKTLYREFSLQDNSYMDYVEGL